MTIEVDTSVIRVRRAIPAQETIREEELNGWNYVHDAESGPDDLTVGD